MKRHWIASFTAVVAILALSACAARDAPLAVRPPAAETERAPAAEIERVSALNILPLLLWDSGDLIEDSDKANEIFSEIFEIDSGDERRRNAVRELLTRLDQGAFVATNPDRLDIAGIKESDIRLLSGLGGFTMAELAHLALNPEVERRTRGLLGDYLVIHDEKSGRGHLSFDLETTIGESGTTILRHYDIEVPVNGFVVKPREGNETNPDPFPNTVLLPEFMLDSTNPLSIWRRGLKYKLFAVGENVVTAGLYIQVDDGRIVEIPPGDARRVSDEASCIDLLTKMPPPTHRIDEMLWDQSNFCFGACLRFIGGTRDMVNSV